MINLVNTGYEKNSWFPYIASAFLALILVILISFFVYSGENVVRELKDLQDINYQTASGVSDILLDQGIKISEVTTSVDVFIQDQTSPPIDFFFTQVNGTPTSLALDVSIDDFAVTVVSATGCSIGNYVGIFNGDDDNDNRAYFGTILNIVGEVITLDTPIDFDFLTGDTFACFVRDLSVDGSVSPQIFSVQIGPSATQSIDITRLMISMITDSAVSLAEFADISSLNNGLVLRRVDGDTRNIWNVKNNGEIANLCFDYTPYQSSNPVQGQDGAKFRYSFAGQDKHGVAVRLDPGDSLQLIVQDDLTAIDQFRVIAEGHYVVEAVS